jgi:hypothetical protein
LVIDVAGSIGSGVIEMVIAAPLFENRHPSMITTVAFDVLTRHACLNGATLRTGKKTAATPTAISKIHHSRRSLLLLWTFGGDITGISLLL